LVTLAVAISLAGCSVTGSYSLSTIMGRSLPLVLKAFGPRARVESLSLSDQDAAYAVVTGDGILHRRFYHCGIHSCPGGLQRGAPDARAAPILASEAVVPLGVLNAAVPDRMLSKLGISAGEADMTLEGPTWTIRDGHRVLYEWQARYDGAGLRLAQTPADIPGASVPQSPHTSTSGTVISTPPTPTPSISSSSQAASQAPGLLACVVAAGRDVTKVVACQRRFQP
jgi:hypothetical protein